MEDYTIVMHQKHMSTLRKNYTQKQLQKENLLHEAALDMFASNSENVKKVKNALATTKSVAQNYGMKNIQNAVASAEAKFEAAIANNSMKDKGAALSYIATFSDIMSDFFRELDQTVMQLPSVDQALQASSDPANSQKTIKDLVGQQGDKIAPITTLTKIIQDQFQKSGGGFLKAVGRFFKTGNVATAQQALQYVGLDAQKAAEDILNVKASQYNQMIQSGKQVPPVQLNAQSSVPQSGTTQSSPTNQSQTSQTTQASQQTSPSSTSTPSSGNAQLSAKPSPQDAQKRDGALQGAVRNRNAFNTQLLSQLSNDEVKADLMQIAKALGINLG
jgi:hypothetical protein